MTSSTLTTPPRGSAPGRRRGPKQREALWGTLLAAPATLHTLLWVGIPIVVAIALSFTSYDVITSARFTGLANYATILSDTLFWRSILHNVIIAGIGIPVSMFLALVFAVLLNRAMPAQGLLPGAGIVGVRIILRPICAHRWSQPALRVSTIFGRIADTSNPVSPASH